MKPAVIPEWRRVLRHAWSLRLMALAGLLSGCEMVLPLFQDTIPRGVFAALTLLASVGAALARFIPQKKVRDGDD